MRHTLGHRSWGCWRKRMSKNEDMTGVESYMDHVANAASFEAYKRKEEDPRVSAETLAASNGMIDFKTFAHDYPDKLMPLLEHLRPEFQELFAEYWLLGKSQSFIGDVHGFIQTRVWQNLRIIEQAIGSLILLGTNANEDILAPILEKVGLEKLARGRLSSMIARLCTNAQLRPSRCVFRYSSACRSKNLSPHHHFASRVQRCIKRILELALPDSNAVRARGTGNGAAI